MDKRTAAKLFTARGAVLIISVGALLIFGYSYTYANTGQESNTPGRSDVSLMEKHETAKEMHKKGKRMHLNPEKVEAGIKAKLESGDITQEQADSFMEKLQRHTPKVELQTQI